MPVHIGTSEATGLTVGRSRARLNYTSDPGSQPLITLSAIDITQTTADLEWTPSDATVTEVGRSADATSPAWVGTPASLPFTFLTADTDYILHAVINGVRREVEIRTLASVVTPPPSGQPSPGLFFALPDTSASTKKMYAHLFPIDPRSMFNENGSADYYATQLMNPTGESSKWIAEGGMLRNRPWPRATRPETNWNFLDMAEEIQSAKAVGVDGFFCNIMRGDEAIFPAARQAAAQLYPNEFQIIPMIDTTTTNYTAAQAADQIQLYNQPTTRYIRNGFFIASNFLAEGASPIGGTPASYWQAIVNTLAGRGIQCRFIHVFLNHATFADFSGTAIGTGVWGTADPASVPSTPGGSGLRLFPVRHQDVRPYLGQFWENLNLECLRAHWNRVITDSPEFVQMVTWGDFAENSAMVKNPAGGQVVLDISAWYASRWKTGVYPPILRDALYLSYRNHVPGAPILLTSNTHLMSRLGPSAERYSCEAMVFLTAPATVEITIAGNTSTYSAPAGMSVHLKPVTAAGTVSARIIRGGTTLVNLAPPVPIRPNLWAQDRQYHLFGSIRGTTGQFDATRTSTGAQPTYPPYVPLYP